MADPVSLSIDGRELPAHAGDLLIAVAEEHAVYIPRFCWHPRLKPVGMCRMCLVEIEGPRGTMLTTSCTTRVTDGMAVHTQSETVKKAQEGILEFLLLNHPLDCPVCDRAGECPLQDQTMAYGPGETRFIEEKRHYPKPIPISDLVLLDRERCILCARCTRFSDEISGDPLIEFVDRGYGTEVNTFPDEPFASYFSGNTVEICPVGALTASPYRFRARPWDLRAVESTCTICAVGCRVSVQASQGAIIRINGVDNDAVNQGWLCDKGRFAFEHLTAADRLTAPLVRDGEGVLVESSWSAALAAVADRLPRDGSAAVIGGARGTNEDAYATAKFTRLVAGTPHVDALIGEPVSGALAAGLAARAEIGDLDGAAAVLVWGPDLKEELPVLYLRVRRAVLDFGARLVVAAPRRTALDDIAAHVIRYRPGEGAAALRRLAAEDDHEPVRQDLAAGRTVALVGRTGLAEHTALADAVAAWVGSLPDGRILALLRRGNAHGAVDMGLAPGLLPGRIDVDDEAAAELASSWGAPNLARGRDLDGIIAGLEDGSLTAVLLVGADPVRDHTDPEAARRALSRASFVVACDLFATDSTALADVVLPVAAFGETEGTVTNLEGRVQKVNRIVAPPAGTRPLWSILEDWARRLGTTIGATSAAALAGEIARVAAAYRGLGWDGLDWGDGRNGVVVPTPLGSQSYVHTASALPDHEAPAGFALHMARVLYDDGTAVHHGPSLAALAGSAAAHLHPDDAGELGVAAGGRVDVGSGGHTIRLLVRLDASLAPGTVFVPFNLDGSSGFPATPTVTVEAVS